MAHAGVDDLPHGHAARAQPADIRVDVNLVRVVTTVRTQAGEIVNAAAPWDWLWAVDATDAYTTSSCGNATLRMRPA